jgi:hypothetical protein
MPWTVRVALAVLLLADLLALAYALGGGATG